VSRLSDGSFFLDYAQVEIDEELLREIAKMTGGQYFRAKNNQDLREIYKTIDKLEKTEIQVTRIKKYSEEFHRWVFLGLLFLLAEFGLRQTWLRSLP
jgi:Ca-activated chloride channel family protein